jgi:drug/metabolite transporter (DMT)-like permease
MAGPLAISGILLLDSASWVAPRSTDWVLFALAGSCSVVAWLGIINGYKRAAPALLAPLEYTTLVGGALAGYLFWGEVPDGWLVAGAAIIIASGLFVVHRELGWRRNRLTPSQ